ncbi:MAG: HNH endonuclease [Gemmataceae bacterium]|nr:HNH endonuclease [Gemmataceae bacterium]
MPKKGGLAVAPSVPSSEDIEFRDVVGFPGYRVGSDGSVWSCWKLIPRPGGGGNKAVMGNIWRQRAISFLPSGRAYVSLCLEGCSKNKYVAHLVLEAFCGPRPDGQEACHEDGDIKNNSYSNLRWDTHAGNMADKVRHGTHNRGVRHNKAILSEEQVRSVRARVSGGESRSSVASDFCVSYQTVTDIVTGKTWGHLDG